MASKKTIAVIITLSAAAVAALVIYIICLVSAYDTTPKGSFYFSKGDPEDFSEELTNLSAQELSEYEPKYFDCMSDFYKAKLDESAQCLYNAALYAVDNDYSCVYFPASCMNEKLPPSRILTLLSCDDPLFEHNYFSDEGFDIGAVNTGDEPLYCFELPHSSEEYSDKREQAYLAAKDIVSDIPADCAEDFDKAGYLYDKAVELISYEHGEYDSNTVPVYDALVSDKHMTVCDGFADSLMLLYNLAGIRTFAAEGAVTDGERHVVDIASLSGEHYYLDPTSDSAAKELGVKGRFYYLMTDDILDSYFKADELPEGIKLPTTGEFPAEHAADIAVTSLSDDEAARAGEILSKNGCVLTAFSGSLESNAYSDFGKALSIKCGKDITVTRKNALVAYTFKEAA